MKKEKMIEGKNNGKKRKVTIGIVFTLIWRLHYINQ